MGLEVSTITSRGVPTLHMASLLSGEKAKSRKHKPGCPIGISQGFITVDDRGHGAAGRLDDGDAFVKRVKVFSLFLSLYFLIAG